MEGIQLARKDYVDIKNLQIDQNINSISIQLEKKENDLISRGVNVLFPPAPFVAAKGDGTSDDSEAINALTSVFETIEIPSGRYKINKQINFRHGQKVSFGKVIFDGAEFTNVNGGALVRVANVGSNYTALPTLSTVPIKGDTELTFSSVHNLQIGDIVCLYDNTSSSWSTARTYYKKGEYAKVANIISDTKVLIDSPLFDSYTINANFGAYKMNMGVFTMTGDLEIIQGFNSPESYGIHILRVKDFINSGNIVTRIKGCYAGVAFEQCFNANFNGSSMQTGDSGADIDYGFVAINSQHITAKGYFVAARHGIANTGKDGIGAVITRDCKYFGTVKSTGTSAIGGSAAFDSHGGCEGIEFEGTIYGGVKYGGSKNKIRATIYANNFGICLYAAELKDFNHDFKTCKLISSKVNSANRGVFDCGGNSTAEIDNSGGGVMDLSDIVLEAPLATLGIVLRMRNTNFNNDDVILKLNNAIVNVSPADTSRSLFFPSDSGRKFKKVDLSNFFTNNYRQNFNGQNANELILYRDSGVVNIPMNTSVNSVSLNVSFNKVFPSNKDIRVSTQVKSNNSNFTSRVVNVTSNSFTIVLYTQDGTNFTANTGINVAWFAD